MTAEPTLREVLRELSRRRRAVRALVAKYGPTRYYGSGGAREEFRGARQGMVAEMVRARLTRRANQAQRLASAQDGRCYLCDSAFTEALPPTVDHVRPRAAGGKTMRNILAACRPCNNTKGSRMPTARELAYLEQINAVLEAQAH